jgi:hypothetical protein
MKDIVRVISIVLFVASLFIPVIYFEWLRMDILLMITGSIAIFLMVLWDLTTGLFLLLTLLICLYRIHVNQLNVFGWISSKEDGDLLRSKSLFTTSEHLERIQSNVFDKDSIEKEMIGIHGVYGEAVYGAQGQGSDSNTIPGFTNKNNLEDNYPLK